MKYGVNFVAEFYVEVEADDQEQAIEFAEEDLYNTFISDHDWDCNECVDLEDES